MIQIDLPWPDKALSPNARVHWAAKAKATKKHRQWAQWASCAFGPIEADKVNVTVTFFPPDRRRYDSDNLVSRVKSYLDGIADSLEIDDSRFVIQAPQRGHVLAHGNVRFEIEVPA